MKSDFVYGDGLMHPLYKLCDKRERQLLDKLTDMLSKVQYAKPGTRTEARREAALMLLEFLYVAEAEGSKQRHKRYKHDDEVSELSDLYKPL